MIFLAAIWEMEHNYWHSMRESTKAEIGHFFFFCSSLYYHTPNHAGYHGEKLVIYTEMCKSGGEEIQHYAQASILYSRVVLMLLLLLFFFTIETVLLHR